MLHITQRLQALTSSQTIDDKLILPFDLRQKSRLRVTLTSGIEVALMLDRGIILRGGDLLQAEDGHVVQVVAAEQAVTEVTADTAQALMCAAYHLGNRHVPLQVGDGWLRLEEDYVLDEMLMGLGVHITHALAPFEPEAGAYGGGHKHRYDDETVNIRQPAQRKRVQAN
jgi:urease accessory protein